MDDNAVRSGGFNLNCTDTRPLKQLLCYGRSGADQFVCKSELCIAMYTYICIQGSDLNGQSMTAQPSVLASSSIHLPLTSHCFRSSKEKCGAHFKNVINFFLLF